MAQEAFMKWNRIEASWKQLKDTFAFRSFGLSDDVSQRLDFIGGEISSVGEGDESHPAAFRPDDREMRNEFSLHIGC